MICLSWGHLRLGSTQQHHQWAQSKSPIHRILGYVSQYCFRPTNFGLVCHTAVDSWYEVWKVERKGESILGWSCNSKQVESQKCVRSGQRKVKTPVGLDIWPLSSSKSGGAWAFKRTYTGSQTCTITILEAHHQALTNRNAHMLKHTVSFRTPSVQDVLWESKALFSSQLYYAKGEKKKRSLWLTIFYFLYREV